MKFDWKIQGKSNKDEVRKLSKKKKKRSSQIEGQRVALGERTQLRNWKAMNPIHKLWEVNRNRWKLQRVVRNKETPVCAPFGSRESKHGKNQSKAKALKLKIRLLSNSSLLETLPETVLWLAQRERTQQWQRQERAISISTKRKRLRESVNESSTSVPTSLFSVSSKYAQKLREPLMKKCFL